MEENSLNKAPNPEVISDSEKIEILSEEVQEIFGKVPGWITRWGSIVIFLVIVSVLLGASMFEVTERIECKAVLTSTHPAHLIKAPRAGSSMVTLVSAGDYVKKNQALAILVGDDVYRDVLAIERALTKIRYKLDREDQRESWPIVHSSVKELQLEMADFLVLYNKYINSKSHDNESFLRLRNAITELQNHLDGWRKQNVLVASVDGRVVKVGAWNSSHVEVDQHLFSVIPHNIGEVVAQIQIPIAKRKAVKVGQAVTIIIDHYATEDMSGLSGQLESVSTYPVMQGQEYVCMSTVRFPKDKVFMYDSLIAYFANVPARAIITTKSMSALSKILHPQKTSVHVSP